LNPSDPSSLLPILPQGAEILIVRLRSLGDVVMLTPALAALRAWRPDLRLSVLLEPAWTPVLEGNPAASEILPARSFATTAWDLRRRRFPIVFNQHGGPASAWLVAASGSPARVCWAGRQFSYLYNVLVPDAKEFFGTDQVHTVEHRLSQFYWTGLPRGPIPRAEIFPQRDALARVEKILRENGIEKEAPYAVLQPGARYFTMRWGIEKFAEIARWLRDSHGLVSIVNLGRGDSKIAVEVRERLGTGSIVFDSLNLRELIAVVSRARLYVGNDTGPMHLAAALGRPVVAIYGSSSSVHWRPWQTEYRLAQNDFPCNPCPGDRCYAFDEPRCILSVTVQQVRNACEELLTERPASRVRV
jgi:ADP-heptose:LPS heptosyltransferase